MKNEKFMIPKTIVVQALPDDHPKIIGRRAQIHDILARGKHVRFTNIYSGVTKDVKEWNVDEDEDLTAYRTTGTTPAVCWRHDQYDISEIEPPTES